MQRTRVLILGLLALVATMIGGIGHSQGAPVAHPHAIVMNATAHASGISYGGSARPEFDYTPGHFVLQYTYTGLGTFKLAFQTDCTFVEYLTNSFGTTVYWAKQIPDCYNSPSNLFQTTLKLQLDGNVVIEAVQKSDGQNVGVDWAMGVFGKDGGRTPVYWTIESGFCNSATYASHDWITGSQAGGLNGPFGQC